MRRYFDLIGKKQCAELIIAEGSPASYIESSEFKDFFKCEVREIGRLEYEKLKKDYEVSNENQILLN